MYTSQAFRCLPTNYPYRSIFTNTFISYWSFYLKLLPLYSHSLSLPLVFFVVSVDIYPRSTQLRTNISCFRKMIYLKIFLCPLWGLLDIISYCMALDNGVHKTFPKKLSTFLQMLQPLYLYLSFWKPPVSFLYVRKCYYLYMVRSYAQQATYPLVYLYILKKPTASGKRFNQCLVRLSFYYSTSLSL